MCAVGHLRHSYSGADCGLLYGRDSSGLIELENVLQPIRCGMMYCTFNNTLGTVCHECMQVLHAKLKTCKTKFTSYFFKILKMKISSLSTTLTTEIQYPWESGAAKSTK